MLEAPNKRVLVDLIHLMLEEKNDERADQICLELVQYWIGLAGLEENHEVPRYSQSGLVLSPDMAGNCAFGLTRTRRYLTAVYQSVSTLLRDQSDNLPVRVLYPGCGPYGILVLPLLVLFSAKQLIVDVIDYHAASIRSLKQIMHILGLDDRIQCAVGDALDYQIPNTQMPDLIVSELLLPGLEKEGHVAINEHLLKQAPEAVLIPEKIDISLCFVDPGTEFNQHESMKNRLCLGLVFSMNRNSLLAADSNSDLMEGRIVNVPEYLEPKWIPCLFTHIQLCEGLALKEYENGLTTPIVYALPKGFHKANTLVFSYNKGHMPGLLCSAVLS